MCYIDVQPAAEEEMPTTTENPVMQRGGGGRIHWAFSKRRRRPTSLSPPQLVHRDDDRARLSLFLVAGFSSSAVGAWDSEAAGGVGKEQGEGGKKWKRE
uniref:Uncharacterized protein n=1 Tax=Leersia perrieri TaxID=77586 RepID=A0A0D9XTQ0_9ORYZ